MLSSFLNPLRSPAQQLPSSLIQSQRLSSHLEHSSIKHAETPLTTVSTSRYHASKIRLYTCTPLPQCQRKQPALSGAVSRSIWILRRESTAALRKVQAQLRLQEIADCRAFVGRKGRTTTNQRAPRF